MLVLPNMGLYAWNHTLDPYSSQQLAGNFARLDDHDHSPGKGKRIGTAAIQDGAITPPKLAVGAIGLANLDDSVFAAFDSSTPSGAVREGWCVVATEQSRNVASYGTLTTPDVVTGIYLPNGGLLKVGYQAMWKSTNASTAQANAQIFLNSNQLKAAAYGAAVPANANPAYITGSNNVYTNLGSSPGGLESAAAVSGFEYTGDVTTGQILGTPYQAVPPGPEPSDSTHGRWGETTIFVGPGTYDVSVQFFATTGTLTVKNRTLWVWSKAFS